MRVRSPVGSKLRLIGIMVAVFVIGIIVGISVAPLVSNSNPNYPTITTSTGGVMTTAQNLVTLSSALKTNSTLSIRISSVALDQVDSPTGYSDYLLTVDAYCVGGVGWQLNMSDFHLLTNELSVYNATSVSAETTPLVDTPLMNCQRVSGQITFAVLNGQKPTKLQYYTDPASVLAETNIPQTSSWVSLIPGAIVNYVNPTTSNLTINASILNSTQYFYSTGMIDVKVTISYQKLNNDPNSITVETITEQDPGFTIVSMAPSPPIAIPGNNQEVIITLSIRPPPSSYSGGIHIGVGLTV